MMKLLLLTLFALALWGLPGWAARKNPESPTKGFSSPQSPAQKVPAHLGKRRKQPTAIELILGKSVAEESRKSGAGVKSVMGEKEKGGKPLVLKNSVLRQKEATTSYLDSQNLWKGDVAKKKLVKVGKKVLDPRKTKASSTTVKPELADPETNTSSAQVGGSDPQWGIKDGLISGKKTPVKEQGALHRAQARKNNNAITYRNVTLTQARKIPRPQHRNESHVLLSPAYKNAGQIKGEESRFRHRNTSWALPSHRNTSWPPTGKEHGTLHQNASLILKWKERSTLSRNNTWTQGEKESSFFHRSASQALSTKEHSLPSINTSWAQSWQKPNVFQRNSGQSQANKKLSVTHRHVSKALPGRGHSTLHRNTSWVEAMKEPTLSQKNASRTLPQEKISPSLKNASQALIEEKPSFPHRNASRALPGKRHGTQHRNASWIEDYKGHRPSHKNASWALPKKNPSSCKNVSQALAGNRHGTLHRCSGQTGAGNIPGAPFRNTTQMEAVNEKSSCHKNILLAGTGTPRWQPAMPKERDEPIMPSLPTTCLLSEHAVACGNAHLKHIPKLNDPGLKTLYLAENEITSVPAGIFLGLPNLEWLDLSKNKLDSAGLHLEAFKNLTKLKRLNLDGNRLTTIPDLPSSLQELKLNDNNLEGLQKHSFQGLSKLLTLELEGNQLHDGNVLPTTFKPLSKLIYLRLDQNHFRTVPPGLPASLQELHLDSNLIEEVSESVFNKTLNLNVLVLSNNKLREDRIAPRAWIDLPKLEALDLSHNRLVHVPSFLPRHLKQLTLHHNHIERIPGYVFAHMKPGLEFLHLSHNALKDDGIHVVSFLGLYRSLAELLLDNNQLQAIPRGILNLKGLQVLRLSHNRIRHVPLNSVCDTRVAEDSNIVSMHLENNLIDRRRIPPTAFSCIKAYHSVVLQPQQNEDDY